MQFAKRIILSFARHILIARACILLLCCLLMACNEDLSPSDKDIRPIVSLGTEGHQVGQLARDFTLDNTLGENINLFDELLVSDAVVLYFTMWCPLCDSHMSSLRQNVKVDFPNVRFLIVDYVSGSLSQSRSAQLANGYALETVLPDTAQTLVQQFSGTMGTTIVIRGDHQILMNEDYKESKLVAILDSIAN